MGDYLGNYEDVSADTITVLLNLKYIKANWGITSMDPLNDVGVKYTNGVVITLTNAQLTDPHLFGSPTYAHITAYNAVADPLIVAANASIVVAQHAIDNILEL